MYSEKNLVYIFTMLECIEKCWRYTADFTSAEELMWANDQKEFNAVISLFIAIGEESKKIDANLKAAVTFALEWSDVAGIRDKISHDYRGIDEDVLWAVIQQDLSPLKTALIDMLKLIRPGRAIVEEFLQNPHYKHVRYLAEIV